MTDHGTAEQPHVLPIMAYVVVFGALLGLTGLTVAVSYLDFGQAAIYIALAVALVKATLVLGYFMHLKFESRLLSLVFVGSLAFLIIFFALTFADVNTRGNVIPEEHNFGLRQDRDRAAAAKAQGRLE